MYMITLRTCTGKRYRTASVHQCRCRCQCRCTGGTELKQLDLVPVSVRLVLDVLPRSLLELEQQLVGHLAALDHRVLEQMRGTEA